MREYSGAVYKYKALYILYRAHARAMPDEGLFGDDFVAHVSDICRNFQELGVCVNEGI